MAQIADLAPAVVVDCRTKKIEIIELKPEEKIQRVKEITEAELKDAAEKERAAKKSAALDKLKLDPKNNDLLIALGLIEPEVEVQQKAAG